jgi:tetratricopeptide (TPR) repeat protein
VGPHASFEDLGRATEEAIDALTRALALVTDPRARATIEFNLGVAHRARPAGDAADNHERAIEWFSRSVASCDPDRQPQDWARAKNALGVAWHERLHGDPTANRLQAIEQLEQALAVRRTLGDGDYTAATLTNLANVYHRLGGADRTAHIEIAIGYYRQALELLHEDNVESRAVVLTNLSQALLDRPGGQRAVNIDDAIAAIEEAASLRTDPSEVHADRLTLANALGLKLTGSRAENLEAAIALVEDVVAYREQHESPARRASAYNSRGILYARRIRGGRAENIEEAVASYRRALQIYTRQEHPDDRAGALNNLATVLRSRPSGDRARNEDEAIDALEEALSIYTREDFPYEWAGTMANLATAFFERTSGDRNDNIDAAIAANEAALTIRRREDLPWDWAATRFNLGQNLWRRHRGDRRRNLQAAADALEDALSVRARESAPDEWAAAQSMLAVVYDELAELGERPLDDAIRAYQNALSVYKPDRFPAEARANANNLAGALLKAGRHADAAVTATAGIAAAELLYAAAQTEDGRRHELDENARLYRIAAEAALALETPPGDVFTLAEQGRGRLLGDWLAMTAAPAPAGVDPVALAAEAAQVEALRDALVAARGTASSHERVAAAAAVSSARGRLEQIWTEIEGSPGGAAWVARRRGERLEARALQAWLSAQPDRVHRRCRRIWHERRALRDLPPRGRRVAGAAARRGRRRRRAVGAPREVESDRRRVAGACAGPVARRHHAALRRPSRRTARRAMARVPGVRPPGVGAVPDRVRADRGGGRAPRRP